MWPLNKTISQFYENSTCWPKVVKGRCIRLFHKKNQCTDCLDVCPEDAIVIGRPGTAVMIRSSCTNCELCVAVCKADAFSRSHGRESSLVSYFVETSNCNEDERLIVSCSQKVRREKDEILVSCIGSFHPAIIIGILLGSCRELQLNFGPCDGCKIGIGKKLTEDAVVNAVHILEQNKLTPFRHKSTPTAIVCTRPFLFHENNIKVPGRRDMLLHLIRGLKHISYFTTDNGAAEEATFEPKYHLLQKYLLRWAQREGHVSTVFVAHHTKHNIDKHRCKGCGLCTILCPNGALVQQKQKEMPGYIRGNCSSCRLCVSGCPQMAIAK